jgi:hypothetical protein
MKEAYYFPHDANARTDAKILELRAEMGWEGYGLWWALVEQMREAGDYKLSNTLIGGLAMGLAIPKDKLRTMLDLCISVGLLKVEGECFYSPSLRRRLVALDNKRLARVESARNAAEKRWQSAGNADAMRTHSEGNAPAMRIDATIEENTLDLTKLEESKEEEEPLSLRSEDAATAAALPEKKIEVVEASLPQIKTPADASHTRGAADVGTRKGPARRAAFAAPDPDELLAYMLTQRPHNNPADVERVAAKCFGYYSGNGWRVGKNPMKDWKGACQTFLADLPKLSAPVAGLAAPLPTQSYGTAYGRPIPPSQISIRTAAIAQADALVDAMASGYKPYDL